MANNSVNVLDAETFVRQFMVEQIKKTYPDMDTGTNSSFDDIFIKPMVSVASRMMQAVSLIEYRTNLKYASKLTDDQLSDIGENNYGVTRKEGEFATVVQTFSFSRISEDGITIPAGVIVSTDDGYEFYTKNQSYFPYADVVSGYNSNNRKFNVSVTMHASNPGSDYNKGANTINICKTGFNSYLISTTNAEAASGGTDQESVEEYVNRMRTYYISQHLGSKPGYSLFVKTICPEISNVKVVGYGDTMMTRDVIRFAPLDTDGNVILDGSGKPITRSKHVGGCVDIYVRGSEYQIVTEEALPKSRYILIDGKVDTAEGKDNTGKIYKTSGASAEDGILTIVNIDTWLEANSVQSELLAGKTAIIVGESDADIEDEMSITLTLGFGVVDGEPAQVASCTYTIAPGSEISVTSPLSQDVISAVYTDRNEKEWGEAEYRIWKQIIGSPDADTTGAQDCTIKRFKITGEEITDSTEFKDIYVGSSQEKNTVVVSPYFPNCNAESLSQNGKVNVMTSYNLTLNRLASSLSDEGNRIVTGDILAREASTIDVTVSVEVCLVGGSDLSELQRSQIHSVVSKLFDALPVGGVIEQSDIVGELYSNPLTKDYIRYIRVPLKKFYAGTEEPESMPDYICSDENSYLTLKNFTVNAIL